MTYEEFPSCVPNRLWLEVAPLKPKPLIRSHSPDLWLGKHQGAQPGPQLPQRPEARSQGWDRRGEGPWRGGRARREGHGLGWGGYGGILTSERPGFESQHFPTPCDQNK